MPIPRERLRLSEAEVDEMLARARTMRLATVGADGWPHVVPLWFVWHHGALWVNNLRKSKRSSHLAAGSPVAACIDEGEQYGELRGVVLYGRFGDASSQRDLPVVKDRFARKYWNAPSVPDLRSHQWLLMRPERQVSWDFRKIPHGADRRLGIPANDA